MMAHHTPGRFVFAIVAILSCGSSPTFAQDPLFTRIDQFMDADRVGPTAALASDAEFIRRLSLDLVGTIPTAAETRAFLQDTNPNKRASAVDRYIADPRFALYWAELFDVMLMERRPDKHVPHAEWLKYLQGSFQQNKPWNQLAREILSADGTDPALRPAAKFFLDRDAEPNLMTRDTGRIFFGVDLQCAQCHDHPLVEHYAQSDYYGLFAFVNRTVTFNHEIPATSPEAKPTNRMELGEKAEGVSEYKSVFTGDASHTRPRLPGGMEIDEPHFRLGDEYVTAPADKVRPVPKYSRRAKLAELATNGENAAFNRNIANRVWGMLFGRGLVSPADMHHPHNPPTHPEVLNLITQHLVEKQFNIRELVRELALTQTYQRSFDLPADPTTQLEVANEKLKAIEPQLTTIATGVDAAKAAQTAAYEEAKAAQKATEEKEKAYRDAIQAAVAARKPLSDAQAALGKTQQAVTAKQAVVATLTDASTKAAEAVKVIPNDAELTQAATIYTNKLTAANTELAALQKTATDQTAAVDAAQQKLTAAVDASEAAFAQVTEAAKPWEAAKQKWIGLRAQTLTAEVSKQNLTYQQKAWKQYAEFGQKRQTAALAEQTVPTVQAELASAQQTIPPQMAEVAAKVTALGEAQKVLATATQSLEAAKADYTAKQTITQTLMDAAAKTEAALALLPNDAELTAALGTLKARQSTSLETTKAAEVTVATKTTEVQTATSQMTTAQQQQQAAETELENRKKTVETKTTALAQAQAAVVAAQAELQSSYGELAEAWANQAAIRTVKPLSPEQFAWSLMEACGIVDSYRNTSEAEVEKAMPKASVEADPVKKAERDFQVAQLTREKLRGVTNQFIGLYAAAGGQPQDVFFATADQALFVANGGTVIGWGTNLANRLNAITDVNAAADELYHCVFSRPATPAEASQLETYLSGRPNDRPVALKEVVWALLASAEFRFNH